MNPLCFFKSHASQRYILSQISVRLGASSLGLCLAGSPFSIIETDAAPFLLLLLLSGSLITMDGPSSLGKAMLETEQLRQKLLFTESHKKEDK